MRLSRNKVVFSIFLYGCSADNNIYVNILSRPEAVVQLHLNGSLGGHEFQEATVTRTLDRFIIEPTTDIEGTLQLHIDGLDTNATIIAYGDSASERESGQRTELTVPLKTCTGMCCQAAGWPSTTEAQWTWLNPLPHGNDLYVGWANSDTDFWAAGENGILYHWNGITWKDHNPPSPSKELTSKDIRGLWGSGSNDMWAVGEDAILHYDGSVWKIMTSLVNLGVGVINAVSGTSTSDVWFVGENGTLIHYDGSNFQKDTSRLENLYGIWGDATNNYFAVGNMANSNDPAIIHFNGTNWQSTTVAGLPRANLSSIWGYGNEQWLVGSKISNEGTLYHVNTGAWYLEQNSAMADLTTIYGFDVNNVWAAGFASGDDIVLLRRNGARWDKDPILGQVSSVNLFNLSGKPSQALWAVGSSGTVLTRKNNSWQRSAETNSLTNNTISGLWGSACDNVWAIDDRGIILHFDGNIWSSVRSPTIRPLRAIAGLSDKDIWAVGDLGTILRYTGGNWFHHPMSQVSITYDLRSIWPNNSSDVWAVGNSGSVVHYNGSQWSALPLSENADLNSVWGVNKKIWTVGKNGQNGRIFKYENGWNAEVLPPGIGPLFGIWGSSEADIWAIGESGVILHFNGTRWELSQQSSLFPASLLQIWGNCRNDVWAAGQSGTLLHYDGLQWSRVPDSSSVRRPNRDLSALWSCGSQDRFWPLIWVGGSRGALLQIAPYNSSQLG